MKVRGTYPDVVMLILKVRGCYADVVMLMLRDVSFMYLFAMVHASRPDVHDVGVR
jgi:hypothetical protein